MLLVHGFLVLRESRRSLSVEPVQVVTLCAKVTCTGINGVEIMTRVPRRHGDRHGESKGTSTKISDLKKMVLAYLILRRNQRKKTRFEIPRILAKYRRLAMHVKEMQPSVSVLDATDREVTQRIVASFIINLFKSL